MTITTQAVREMADRLRQHVAFHRDSSAAGAIASMELASNMLHALVEERDRLLADIEMARTILAGPDIGSLPNDWTLPRIAEARWDDWHTMRDQVRDTCARAEAAEAERDRLLAEEPTEAMSVAGGLKMEAVLFEGDTDGNGLIFDAAAAVYRTMRHAALKETRHG